MINLLRSLGWVENFFHLWFSAWMLSWLAAFPAVLILLPLVRRIAGLLVDMTPPSPPQR